jgi:hypothetical protein
MNWQNRFKATNGIRNCWVRVPAWSAAPYYKTCDLFRSAGRERIWQLRSQKGAEHSNDFYVFAPTAFRSKVCGAEYCETNEPETEVWRACQRSSTGMEGGTTASGCWVTSAPARVYLVEGPRILTNAVLPSPGLSQMSSVKHATAVETLNSYVGATGE